MDRPAWWRFSNDPADRSLDARAPRHAHVSTGPASDTAALRELDRVCRAHWGGRVRREIADRQLPGDHQRPRWNAPRRGPPHRADRRWARDDPARLLLFR